MSQRHSSSSARQKLGPTNKNSTLPILKLLLGVLLLGFFLLALLLQVQTSEAFFLGEQPTVLSADWSLLTQPVALLAGKLPLPVAQAAMWGYGIELVYLVCVIGEVSICSGAV